MLSGKCVCGISWLVGIRTECVRCERSQFVFLLFSIHAHAGQFRNQESFDTCVAPYESNLPSVIDFVLWAFLTNNIHVFQIVNYDIWILFLCIPLTWKNARSAFKPLTHSSTRESVQFHEKNLVGCALTPPSMPMFHAYVLHKCSPKHPCRSVDFECMVCVLFFIFIRFLSRSFSIFRGNEQTLRTLKNTCGVRPYQMKMRRFSQMCACECIVPPSLSYST